MEDRKGSGTIGKVRAGSGSLGVVRDGRGTFDEVRDGLGDPSLMSGMGRGTLG